MSADKRINWDGDTQFAINDIEVNDRMLESPELVIEAAIADATNRGLSPIWGVTLATAALGPCSRCGDWTRERRIMAFEPSDSRAFGAEPGRFNMFYFSLCSGCKGALSNAEQRAWATDRAREMATSLIGADGPKQ